MYEYIFCYYVVYGRQFYLSRRKKDIFNIQSYNEIFSLLLGLNMFLVPTNL